VYILDSGKVDIYVNGVFDETPPEEKDAGEAKRTGSGATAHTDESGANRVDYDPYADLRDLNLPGAGTGFAGAPGAGFEDDPYLTATMPQMAVADDDGEAGWGMYENLEEEMAAKAAAEAAERQAEEEAERARINAEAMARDKATVTLERSDSEDDDEDEEEEEVKENEGGDEEKREGREKDGVDEKGPDAGVEEGKGGAVVEGGAAVEVPKLPKAKRDLVERKVYVCSLDEPGSIFGEVACLMGGSRTATIVASADTKVFCIKKEAIDKLLDEHPETLESILAMVSERREYAAQVLADAGAVEGLVDEVGEVAVDPESTEALQLSEVELMQMFLATKGKLSELNVLDDGEEYVAEIEQLCDNMATSADWADGGGPAQLLGYLQKVYEVFQKEEEEVHRSVADGDTMDKLDSQINRLIRVKDKAEDGLPDTPRTKAERNLRSKTHIRIKKSQLQVIGIHGESPHSFIQCWRVAAFFHSVLESRRILSFSVGELLRSFIHYWRVAFCASAAVATLVARPEINASSIVSYAQCAMECLSTRSPL
jgi:CRP/FNR family cyclic AMP-dependent transcriptional regulator